METRGGPVGQGPAPAIAGWTIGALLIALGPPLWASIGFYAAPLGLVISLWVMIRAARYGALGFTISLGVGLLVGFSALVRV